MVGHVGVLFLVHVSVGEVEYLQMSGLGLNAWSSYGQPLLWG